MGWLSDDDLLVFATEGYLLVRDAVPEALMACADEEIDALVANTEPQEGQLSQPGQCAWFPPRARLPKCDDLLRRSPALEIAMELVAPNGLDHAFDHIQVATTNPGWAHSPGGPHIDGHGPGAGPPDSFTLLAGVLLTDQRARQSGNLWVWPGSHLRHEALFNEKGSTALKETGGHSTLLDPPLALYPGTEVFGRRGDLLLAHYMLGHNKGGNRSQRVRRTVYYRLAVPGHAERWEQTFLNAWTEYPRIGPLV